MRKREAEVDLAPIPTLGDVAKERRFEPLCKLLDPVKNTYVTELSKELRVALEKRGGQAKATELLLESFFAACDACAKAASLKRLNMSSDETLFDVSTPDKVLEWVKGVALQRGFTMRHNAFDPGPRFCSPAFGDACWNRDDVVKSAVRYFKQVVGLEGAGSTEHCGICATFASRGCGKTFLLDRLCRLHNTRDDERQEWILGDQLNDRLVPVCISFNGPQDIEVDVLASSKGKLLSRIAHRAFLDGSPQTWGKFSRFTAGVWDRVRPNDLFEALLLYFQGLGVENPVILLAVDEMIKCGEEQAIEIMRTCKSFVSAFTSKCRLLVTTFDNHQLLDGYTASPRIGSRQPFEKRAKPVPSQRPIEWLPLEPLDVANPRALLATLSELKDEQLDFLISLSGGHPRSLALLKFQLVNAGQRSLTQLLSDWRRQVQQFVNHVEDEVIEMLLAKTLLGETIGIDDVVAGASVTSLVQDTVILNALDPDAKPRFVPQLSLLRLHHWCEQSNSNLRIRLRALLDLGHNLQHRSFEEFHAIFEELRSWAWHKLGRAENTTLSEWIPPGRLIRGGDIQLAVPKPQLLKTETLSDSLSQHCGLLERCYLAHDNQHGFDVLQAMGGLLIYDCRCSELPMSEDKSATKLTPSEDVRRKSVMAQEEVQASDAKVGGETVHASRSAYILLISGNCDSAQNLEGFVKSCNEKPAEGHKKAFTIWEQFSKLQMTVVVLNRQGLLQHYGPTFRSLGGFMLDYSARNQG